MTCSMSTPLPSTRFPSSTPSTPARTATSGSDSAYKDVRIAELKAQIAALKGSS